MQKPSPKISAYMTENPHSVTMHEPLSNAYALMRRHDIHHIPVLLGDKLVGLITEPEPKIFELITRMDLNKLRVEEAMTPVPYAVTEDARLIDVAREMARSHYNAALVMRESHVVGVFTITDALRALSEVLAHESHHK